MSLKSISKNTAIYSLGTVALRFTTFLLIPLYTHHLTKVEFGLLQTLLFTIQIIITVNDVGMRSALMRFFAEYEINNKLKDLLGSSFTLNIFMGLIFIIVAFLLPDSFISSFFKIDHIPNLLLFTVFVGVSQTLSLNILSYFRAKDQGLIYMIISLITSLMLIFTTYLLLVVYDYGILGVLWAQSLTFLLMWLAVLLWIFFKHGLVVKKVIVKKLLRFGFPLIFAMSGDIIINTSGNYLLGHFHDLELVAIFSLAYKISTISIMILIGPFQMAYEPYIFRNKNSIDLSRIISRICIYIMFSFVILSFGILFIFRDLINVFGDPQYSEAYILIFLLMPGLGFTAFSYIGQSLLHINNKTKTTGIITIYSIILGFIVMYFLVQYYGIYGLIISLNFYLIFSSMVLFIFGKKEITIKLDLIRLVLIFIWGVVLFSGVYLFSFLSDYLYYSLTPLLFVSSVVILVYSNFFSDEEKYKFSKFVKNLCTNLN